MHIRSLFYGDLFDKCNRIVEKSSFSDYFKKTLGLQEYFERKSVIIGVDVVIRSF